MSPAGHQAQGLEARLRRIPSICSMGQAEQGLQQGLCWISEEIQRLGILQGKAAGIFLSYWEAILMSSYLKKNMSQKHVCPCKVLEKSMPQTIDSSSKNDMYIMDFPTAHRLRHKKTTAAQVTTLTLYIRYVLQWQYV